MNTAVLQRKLHYICDPVGCMVLEEECSMAKGRVSFFHDSCKACGLCIHFCPRNILDFDEDDINPLGFHPVIVVKPEECTGCAICALMCPDLVIEVEKG